MVKTQNGDVTVKLTGDTDVPRSPSKGTATDLKTGEQVVVSGQTTRTARITANTVRQGSFAGGFRNPRATPSK